MLAQTIQNLPNEALGRVPPEPKVRQESGHPVHLYPSCAQNTRQVPEEAMGVRSSVVPEASADHLGLAILDIDVRHSRPRRETATKLTRQEGG